MAALNQRPDEIERLKTLLFRGESDRLAHAELQIEQLQARVGDLPRLEAATSEIIVKVLHRAEAAQHRELAAALAPVVVASIRNEIINSKDMMVEALYPITGRLVTAGIAVAFKELLAQINARLAELTSAGQWRVRMQSWTSGRPMAEILLAQAHGAAISRVMLLASDSGKMLAYWRANAIGEENPELVSGMIAAVSGFASDVLAQEHGELRTLDTGASTIYLRSSAQLILAAEATGELGLDAQRRLETCFLGLVDHCGEGKALSEDDLRALGAYVAPPAAGPAARPSRGGIAWVALAILGVLALLLYGPLLRWRKEAAIQSAFQTGLAANPTLAAYPLNLQIDSKAGLVTLSGLASQPQAVAAMEQELRVAAQPYALKSQVEMLATAAMLRSAQEETSARVDATKALAQRVDATLSASAANQALGLEANRAAIIALDKQTSAGLNKTSADLATLSDRAQADSSAHGKVVGEVQARLANEAAAARAQLKSVAGQSDALSQRLAAQAERLAAVDADVAAWRPPGETPHQHLVALLPASIIYYADQTTLADPAKANATLDQLAVQIRSSGDSLRVVGYADNTAGAGFATQISRKRADLVMQGLLQRGISANRLVSVGRGTQSPLVDFAVAGHERNRRVEFELMAGPPTSR